MGDSSRGALPRMLAGAAIASVLVTTYAVRAQTPVSLASITSALPAGVLRGPAEPDLAIQVEPADSLALPTRVVEHELEPPPPDTDAEHPVPVVDGAALDARFASLAGWVHPVVGTDRVLAELPTGMFGAERSGVMRRECRRGHCGIDISGPIGRPIVAVAGGVVVHVDRSEHGKDGRSGRYVRIEHDDGVLTSYMHLSRVAAGLERGDRVAAGQQLGTLGASGVNSAAPHLHFALELPRGGRRGDRTNTRYVDPAPFLVRATVRSAADRRRGTKPAI